MTIFETDWAGGEGYVVLAAYRPDPELFRRQLRSIQAQTVSAFHCLIVADGEADSVLGATRQAVGNDPRFEVIGFENRVGFYRNFERGLATVPHDARWIALSDQDDAWYPDKLEKLLPHLRQSALVSGQARVVSYPAGEILSVSTNRKNVGVTSYFLDNQFTGSLSVFRGEVLGLALPFPSLRTPAEVHDHWLAVCAHFLGGASVVNDVVQDYVQHKANVIGESDTERFRPTRSWATLTRTARRYEDGITPRRLARATYNVGVGWRSTMAAALGERLPQPAPQDYLRLEALYGRDRRLSATTSHIFRSVRAGTVSPRSAVEYVAGWLAGTVFRLRGPGDRPASR
ncbi:glycosyltransferase [Microbacterium sp. ABRD28]|uniref:glycosyltransferase n=1 Tax=Microbacterium sp. ABRD28 TaxID=2268461 RepID=UPI0013DE2942|nr:glycosyltransferase [Microbacterium sp. ABRD28]